ncbi:hypothetical protein QBC41DRAFT_95735 [Cercophora samala]|uniref:Uncharacterized protein n=1 Tax=Cercophora samala TaxID=330535 RepID=A0AA39ZGD2_9PEZI|nr:hypothetical protein QBC41DRAFT_95735 [Cercophora samala]
MPDGSLRKKKKKIQSSPVLHLNHRRTPASTVTALMPRLRCALCEDWLPGYFPYDRDVGSNPKRQKKQKVFGDIPFLHRTRAQIQKLRSRVHDDCLRLFIQHRQISELEALTELWEFSTWCQPWNIRPKLQLANDSDILPVDHFAAALGLPELSQRLCPELTKMVQDFSADSLVWRLTRVSGLAKDIPPPSGLPQSFLLSNISAWERGREPVLAADGYKSAMPQVIRLTVDSRGLQRIERLYEKPVYRYGRSESKAFAVFYEMDVQGAVLWFKSGLARLSSGECKSTFAIPIWDTPTPPTGIPNGINIPPMVDRCWTVELNNASGITFVVSGKGIEGVYAHIDGSYPSATNVSHSLEAFEWVYVPTPPGDKITTCHMIVEPWFSAFLFHKQLSGWACIGYQGHLKRHTGRTYQVEHNNTMPTALVLYHRVDDDAFRHRREGFRPGLFVQGYRDPNIGQPSPVPGLRLDDVLLEKERFARLGNVVSIQLFYFPEQTEVALQNYAVSWVRNQVSGMVLSYGNGAQVALGMCRFDLCRTQVFDKPTQIMLVTGRRCCCQRQQPSRIRFELKRVHESRCYSAQTLIVPYNTDPGVMFFNELDKYEMNTWLVPPKTEVHPMTGNYEIAWHRHGVVDWKVQPARA